MRNNSRMTCSICMKLMQHILWYTFFLFIDVILMYYLIFVTYRIHKLWKLREFFKNRTILWWRHFRSRWCQIKTNFGVTRDSGLNFGMKKTDLDFRHLERPWSFWIEAIFSILRLKKSTKKVSNWTSKSSFILNRPHRIRWASRFFSIVKLEDPSN